METILSAVLLLAVLLILWNVPAEPDGSEGDE